MNGLELVWDYKVYWYRPFVLLFELCHKDFSTNDAAIRFAKEKHKELKQVFGKEKFTKPLIIRTPIERHHFKDNVCVEYLTHKDYKKYLYHKSKFKMIKY